jgi:transcriptional regulator with XRE-family HTH domain
VLDGEQIIEDLVRLRNSRSWSQRTLAQRSGISREIVRKIETREHPIQVDELFAWLHACGVSPVLWLLQYLNQEELKVRDKDRHLAQLFQRALRIPQHRKTIEAVLGMLAGGDDIADTPQRSPTSRRGAQKDGHA